MKNQYFADANDYRKYGLLRCIAEVTGLEIGVLWLLTRGDGRKDGEFRRYLRDPRWAIHDPPLHAALSKLIEEGARRDVGLSDRWGLVPGATYFDEVFTDDGDERRATFARAMERLAHCPVVFLDPDNGVEVASVRFGTRNSSRYVYWEEVTALFERGHSLLVYQHYRREARTAFEASLSAQFKVRLAPSQVAVFSTPHVAFFLALQDRHAGLLPAIREKVNSRWRGQISEGAGGAV